MARDFSFEDKITEGKVQRISQLVLSFDKAEIVFENTVSLRQKVLKFSRIISLSLTAQSDGNTDEFFRETSFSEQTLFGFDYEKSDDGYVFCIRTDDYVIFIKSPDFAVMENL